MSRTLDRSQSQAQQSQRSSTVEHDYSAVATNSDALAELATSESSLDSDGFLDSLIAEQDELADLEARASAPADLISNPKHTFESRSDDPDAGTSDKTSVGTDLKSVSGSYQAAKKDGVHSRTHAIGGKFDRDKVSISGGRTDATKIGPNARSSTAYTLGADTDGNVNGNVTVTHDQQSASVGGNVDLAEDGSIEHLDVNVARKTANGTSFEGKASIDPKTIETKGRTVSWSIGGEVGGKVGRGDGSVGGELGRAQQQTRTFASEAEAQEFAAGLHHSWQDNRELDFAAMEPGTAASFFIETTGSGKGSAGVASAEVKGTHAQRFDVACNAAGMLEVEIDEQGAHRAGLGARSGTFAVGGGASDEANATTRMEIDPSSPAALEALHALVNGGQLDPSVEIPGLRFGMETDERSCVDGSMDLAVAQISQKACEGKGVYRDFATGEHGTVDTAHTSESESPKLDWLSALCGYDRSGEQGSSSEDAKVYEPEFVDGRGGTHMRFEQVFDFQQREISRRLHDQVTPYTDREAISEHELPSPDAAGMDEKQKWVLETVIDAEGTQAVFDGLAHGDQSFEWDAQRLLHSVRKALLSGAKTPAEAVTAFAQGGEDAYEGMRDLAGAEHTERFLMQEGSDVWIGRKANRELDDRIAGLAQAVSEGDELSIAELQDILDSEEARDEALGDEFAKQLGGSGMGVPTELLAEAMDRAGARCAEIQRILDTKEPR